LKSFDSVVFIIKIFYYFINFLFKDALNSLVLPPPKHRTISYTKSILFLSGLKAFSKEFLLKIKNKKIEREKN